MNLKEVQLIIQNIDYINPNDENAYEKVIIQLMSIKPFPVITHKIHSGEFLFRSKIKKRNIFFDEIDKLSITPNKFIQSFGRCNRPFQSKFYASENRPTSYAELLESWVEGKENNDIIYVTVGMWELKNNLNSIIITTPDSENRLNQYDKENGIILDEYIAQFDSESQEAIKEIYRFFFDRFRKISKNNFKNYIITSAITNLSLSLADKNVFAITYPSVPLREQGINVAINKDFLTQDNIFLTKVLRSELLLLLDNESKHILREINQKESKQINYKTRKIIW